ncbi:unnamed protein product [Toxocara canis]|uniref:phosphogluconate dehydrogenase (NADP(+)-dependent, decarboxylating) n=1 Tax=Toxocara canis TaxID=6265 RepID=A0A183V768_TOXCA|nr:unnamed protein product [Toxocara canis]
MYASKIVSYVQSFMLMAEATRPYDWKLNFAAVALIRRGGCIICPDFWGISNGHSMRTSDSPVYCLTNPSPMLFISACKDCRWEKKNSSHPAVSVYSKS